MSLRSSESKLSLRTKLLTALAIPLVFLALLSSLNVGANIRAAARADDQLAEVDDVVVFTQFGALIRNERDLQVQFDATSAELDAARSQVDSAVASLTGPDAVARLGQRQVAEIGQIRDNIAAAREVLPNEPSEFVALAGAQLASGIEVSANGSLYGAFAELDRASLDAAALVQIDQDVLVDPATAQNLASLQLAVYLDNRVRYEAQHYVVLSQLPTEAITNEVVAIQSVNLTESGVYERQLLALGDSAISERLQTILDSEIWNEIRIVRDRVSGVGSGDGVSFDTADVNRAIDSVAGDLVEVQTESVNTLYASAFESRSSANRTAQATVVAALAVLALVGVVLFLLYRSIRRPISNLTSRSRSIAEVELPEIVTMMRRQSDLDDLQEIEPIKAETDDEIGELVHAFNGMHRTAVTLASEQAASRRVVGDMFVNLGRRNQKLLMRMLDTLDVLEQDEQDPERLRSLYLVDRLATRMRRNAESLLVLAGARAARRIGEPVALSEIARTAVGEVEDIERMSIQVRSDAMIDGAAAVDVAHLLAELAENALQYSPPTSHPELAIARRSSGIRVAIVDDGFGMDDEQLDESNRRIREAGTSEETPSRQLGFFVVGRLATRHGIDVKLMGGLVGGTVATVDLPSNLIVESQVVDVPVVSEDVAPLLNKAPDRETPARAMIEPPAVAPIDVLMPAAPVDSIECSDDLIATTPAATIAEPPMVVVEDAPMDAESAPVVVEDAPMDAESAPIVVEDAPIVAEPVTAAPSAAPAQTAVPELVDTSPLPPVPTPFPERTPETAVASSNPLAVRRVPGANVPDGLTLVADLPTAAGAVAVEDEPEAPTAEATARNLGGFQRSVARAEAEQTSTDLSTHSNTRIHES